MAGSRCKIFLGLLTTASRAVAAKPSSAPAKMPAGGFADLCFVAELNTPSPGSPPKSSMLGVMVACVFGAPLILSRFPDSDENIGG
jgi:hypothetical protein